MWARVAGASAQFAGSFRSWLVLAAPLPVCAAVAVSARVHVWRGVVWLQVCVGVCVSGLCRTQILPPRSAPVGGFLAVSVFLYYNYNYNY